MTEEEFIAKAIEELKYHIIVWKNGEYYQPVGSKQELYKRIYELRKDLYDMIWGKHD